MVSYVSPARAARIRAKFRRLEDTIEVVFWDLAWTLWRKDRPDTTWASGANPEVWEQVATGNGRLRENGSGGPLVGEDVIVNNAPYVLRTLATSPLEAGMFLVIEDRLFKVEAFLPRAGDRQHARAYLSEMIDATLPAVTP